VKLVSETGAVDVSVSFIAKFYPHPPRFQAYVPRLTQVVRHLCV